MYESPQRHPRISEGERKYIVETIGVKPTTKEVSKHQMK